MKIEFINHASYLLIGEIKILCDPWLDGTAFNNGWSLILPSEKSPEKLAHVDYIWISHEHPDHFDPKFFTSIPEESRIKIKILFQWTKDKRVIKFLNNLGYTTIELPLGKKYFLDNKNYLICDRVGMTIDSFLFIEFEGVKILNLNDCQIINDRILQNIKKTINHSAVNIFFNQFNYANWLGNEDRSDLRRKWASNKVNQNKKAIDLFKPKYFIPFASYCYFSHVENFYMNDSRNSIDKWHDTFDQYNGNKTLIMAPGDVWEYGTDHNSKTAINKYETQLKNIKPNKINNNVSEKVLIENGVEYAKNNMPNLFLILYLLVKNKYRTSIFIWDHNQSYIFSYGKGLIKVEKTKESCDYEMSSDSLNFIFKNSFGPGTLCVNARYRTKFIDTKDLSIRFLSGVLFSSGLKLPTLIYRIFRKKIKY